MPATDCTDVDASVGAARSRAGTALGALLLLLALLLNKRAVERVFARDELIESSGKAAVIVAFQVLLGLVGLVWIVRRRPVLWSRPARTLAISGAALAVGAGIYANLLAFDVIATRREFHDAITTMVASENRLLTIKKDFPRFDRAAMDLRLPDDALRPLFQEVVEVKDLGRGGIVWKSEALGGVLKFGAYPLADGFVAVPAGELALLSPFFSEVAGLRYGKHSLVKGAFVDAKQTAFEGEVGFDAVATTTSGRCRQVSAGMLVRWREGATAEDPWRIDRIELTKMSVVESPRPLFEESLESVIGDAAAAAAARDSEHYRQIVRSYLDPSFVPPYRHWHRAAFDDHPGLAVADVDRDGYDDLYLVDRAGPALLFRAKGDGSFEEAAARFGLALSGHLSSACFADLDNDGDPDLIVGRTLLPSLYLRNEDGRFVDRSAELVPGGLPSLVSSIAVVDADSDGLLDVYLSTYAREKVQREWDEAEPSRERGVLAEFLPPSEARALHDRLGAEGVNLIRDCPGPPNVLLWNDGGGRLSRDDGSAGLAVWRNTYQSGFADVDGDGDQDLYCANDYAPNNLFRNLGGRRFEDITQPSGTEDIGFGMGVSFGDYDDDQDLDLYVSNMFSKAGRRMTAQIPGIDERFVKMAGGNSLFRNDGPAFAKVSGLAAPAQLVEKSGWAWGGLFTDLDLDGHHDLVAVSGYETAPRGIEGPIDR